MIFRSTLTKLLQCLKYQEQITDDLIIDLLTDCSRNLTGFCLRGYCRNKIFKTEDWQTDYLWSISNPNTPKDDDKTHQEGVKLLLK